MRHVFLSILIVAMIVCAEAQTKSSRTQSHQRRTRTNKATRQRVLTPRQVASLAFPSTVSIYALGDGEDLSSGAGFIVGPDMVATCYHVVENARGIVVTPIGDSEDRHKALLVRYDKERDVALLFVRSLKGRPLKVTDKSDFYIGETIYTLGNPKGLEGTFSNGIISNFLRVEDTFYLQFTAPVSPGNSGGPVLGNTGEVVGMVNMQLKEGQNLNFAILAVHVRMLMEGRRDLPSDTYMDNNLGRPSRRKPN
jgi:S1-C subfamily serine protease